MIIENEKGKIEVEDHRSRITKVRGGWTKEKIIRELKRGGCQKSELAFLKEIAKYDTPEEFAENLYYHGSANSIDNLKPSIALNKNVMLGGGYDSKYYGISLSKDREIASNFTGASHFGNVAPVLLKRGSVIKNMPEISDAIEIEDIITELWAGGVDAVIIGDHSKDMSEKEIVILNPRCIVVGKSKNFKVFNKEKTPSFNKEELVSMWKDSSKKYKEYAEKSWEQQNDNFKKKYGKSLSTEKFNSKQKNIFNFHMCNLEKYEKNKNVKKSAHKI